MILDFAETTPEISAKADAVVREVRRQYAVAAVRIGFSPDAIARFMALGIGAAIPPLAKLLESSQEQAIRKNFQALGDRIKKWETTYRRWAEKSRRDDGSPYSWARWIEFGSDLASEIQSLGREAWDSSVFVSLAKATATTAAEAVETAKKIGEKAVKAAPGLLKYLSLAVVVGGAAYIFYPFVKARRRAGQKMASEAA